jgi:hypothetical protein
MGMEGLHVHSTQHSEKNEEEEEEVEKEEGGGGGGEEEGDINGSQAEYLQHKLSWCGCQP